MHVCNMEPTHHQCIRAASDVKICIGTPDTSLLRSLCVMPSVPERKEWRKNKSQFYHGSLYIDLLILEVLNAISNKNKSLCSWWCWWKQGWGISFGDVCLSYLCLLSDWIRLLSQRHKHYSERNCFSRWRLWNNICMAKGSTMIFILFFLPAFWAISSHFCLAHHFTWPHHKQKV